MPELSQVASFVIPIAAAIISGLISYILAVKQARNNIEALRKESADIRFPFSSLIKERQNGEWRSYGKLA